VAYYKAILRRSVIAGSARAQPLAAPTDDHRLMRRGRALTELTRLHTILVIEDEELLYDVFLPKPFDVEQHDTLVARVLGERIA
jgi:hypothetical protein